MDANLETASTYVNNLLLARGLLRNGKPVDFAALHEATRSRNDHDRASKKDKRAEEESQDSSQVVVQVINLVHDLILRRDRDQDQLSSLSSTLSTLRTTQTQQTSNVSRLETSNSDLRRQLAISNASVRSANTALHTAEASAKALREELARVKTTLGQVRQQCANDVRKRDVQIARLKSHLTGTQRGSNTRIVGASCTISTSSQNSRGNGVHLGGGSTGSGFTGASSRDEREEKPSLEDAGYSLKQETTEFLTQLSQSMSDENDALIALVKDTLSSMRELMGLPKGPAEQAEASTDELLTIVPTSFATLSSDLAFVLSRLQVLLTRDDFVPISEVYARDEEILRLRDGWEKMGVRWQEAAEMMSQWQEKLSGGGRVDTDDLTRGMNLGVGLQHLNSPTKQDLGQQDEEPADESLVRSEEDRYFDEPDLESPSPVKPSPPVINVLSEASANVASPSTATSRARKLRQQQDVQQQENTTRTPTLSRTGSGSSEQSHLATRLSGLSVQPKSGSGTIGRRRTERTPITSTTTTTISRPPTSTTSTRHATLPRSSKPKGQPASPIHRHLNTLLHSSSSPDTPPSTRYRSVRDSQHGSLRANRTAQRPVTATSTYSSPSKARTTAPRSLRSRPTASRMATDLSAESFSPARLEGVAESPPRNTSTPTDDEGEEDDDAHSGSEPLSISAKLRLADDQARRIRQDSSSPSKLAVDLGDSDDHRAPTPAAASPAKSGDGKRVQIIAVKSSPSKNSPSKGPNGTVRGKRSRAVGGGTGRRKRKSTLSPEELEALLGSPGL